ncbi:MAG: RNA-binding protein [Candidatus Riflebacteria bacterium]|nr:RNA-binding protein [Candidatus Riflebacteria bacterium]
MGSKLFVGGLSWDTDDAGLRAAFAPFGEIVEAKVVTDRDTGRSRGFGFVSYSDPSSAAEAMSKMNGQMLDGRNLKVDMAADRPSGGRGGGGRGGGGYGGGGRDRY